MATPDVPLQSACTFRRRSHLDAQVVSSFVIGPSHSVVVADPAVPGRYGLDGGGDPSARLKLAGRSLASSNPQRCAAA